MGCEPKIGPLDEFRSMVHFELNSTDSVILDIKEVDDNGG